MLFAPDAPFSEVSSWINSQGLTINNVCQMRDGSWRMNVVEYGDDGVGSGHDFVQGVSFQDVVARMVRKLGGDMDDLAPVPAVQGIVEDFASALARARATLDRLAPA